MVQELIDYHCNEKSYKIFMELLVNQMMKQALQRLTSSPCNAKKKGRAIVRLTINLRFSSDTNDRSKHYYRVYTHICIFIHVFIIIICVCLNVPAVFVFSSSSRLASFTATSILQLAIDHLLFILSGSRGGHFQVFSKVFSRFDFFGRLFSRTTTTTGFSR